MNDGAGLHRLDIQPARFTGMEAANIGDPVFFRRKLEVVLPAFGIDAIHFEAAFHNKVIMPARVTFLKDELPALDPSLPASVREFFPFLIVQREVPVKIR